MFFAMREILPTDPEHERSEGRIALWLDPADIQYLARHCSCAEDASDEQKDRCARIRFRSNSALHKAGIEKEIDDSE